MNHLQRQQMIRLLAMSEIILECVRTQEMMLREQGNDLVNCEDRWGEETILPSCRVDSQRGHVTT